MLITSIALVLSAAPVPGPLAVVKAADLQVQTLVKRGDVPTEALSRKAEEFIDFGELARRALGLEWNSLTPRQREDFTATMKGLLRASYAQKAQGDGKAGANFEYGAGIVEANEARVAALVTVQNGRIPVVYRLFRSSPKARWRIYDVVTDEVSLVDTYADQFRQVIDKKGVEGLLASLKAKRKELESGPPKAP